MTHELFWPTDLNSKPVSIGRTIHDKIPVWMRFGARIQPISTTDSVEIVGKAVPTRKRARVASGRS